ncbi:MAG: hypothetical protein M3O33_04000 [Cyanobacteriota bacterium]|nr:hypothetical protein [Cyanobacteriota bacterium]
MTRAVLTAKRRSLLAIAFSSTLLIALSLDQTAIAFDSCRLKPLLNPFRKVRLTKSWIV